VGAHHGIRWDLKLFGKAVEIEQRLALADACLSMDNTGVL
jgi:hypothetical protein